MKKVLLILFFIGAFTLAANSQSSIVSAGGDASNSSGSVAYSVGQVAVTYQSNNINTIAEGVQQTYEISTIVVNYPGINIKAVVFPNLTINYIQLSLTNFDLSNRKIEGRIYDSNGKFLTLMDIMELETIIDLSKFATGTYYLSLYEKEQLLKSFKIVKVRH